jgi:hypothetical protein
MRWMLVETPVSSLAQRRQMENESMTQSETIRHAPPPIGKNLPPPPPARRQHQDGTRNPFSFPDDYPRRRSHINSSLWSTPLPFIASPPVQTLQSLPPPCPTNIIIISTTWNKKERRSSFTCPSSNHTMTLKRWMRSVVGTLKCVSSIIYVYFLTSSGT